MIALIWLSAAIAGPWVERTDAELAAELRASCERADGGPVLVDFSAPWCVDCKLIQKMHKDPALTAEMANWEEVVVDVGRFERHDDLRKYYQVSGISTWVALRPDRCEAPVQTWPLLRTSTFMPVSEPNTVKSAAELVSWLEGARAIPLAPADALSDCVEQPDIHSVSSWNAVCPGLELSRTLSSAGTPIELLDTVETAVRTALPDARYERSTRGDALYLYVIRPSTAQIFGVYAMAGANVIDSCIGERSACATYLDSVRGKSLPTLSSTPSP